MAAMHSRSPAGRLAALATPAILAVLAALLVLSAASSAQASKKKAPYYYKVWKLKLAEGVPAEMRKQISDQLNERIAANPNLRATLEGAPDPDKQPAKYKKWLRRKKLRAFKINLEVLSYRHELGPMPAPRKGQRLNVAIELRIFGETIPGRVMAFTGEGSATVILEIGRKLRKRDTEVGNHDAIELAVDKALAESVRKLRTAEAANKATKKRKRKSRKKK